jgi:hypothetical protein
MEKQLESELDKQKPSAIAHTNTAPNLVSQSTLTRKQVFQQNRPKADLRSFHFRQLPTSSRPIQLCLP